MGGEYTHLIGGEDVRAGGNAMREAAASISISVSNLEGVLHQHYSRFEELISRLEAAMKPVELTYVRPDTAQAITNYLRAAGVDVPSAGIVHSALVSVQYDEPATLEATDARLTPEEVEALGKVLGDAIRNSLLNSMELAELTQAIRMLPIAIRDAMQQGGR